MEFTHDDLCFSIGFLCLSPLQHTQFIFWDWAGSTARLQLFLVVIALYVHLQSTDSSVATRMYFYPFISNLSWVFFRIPKFKFSTWPLQFWAFDCCCSCPFTSGFTWPLSTMPHFSPQPLYVFILWPGWLLCTTKFVSKVKVLPLRNISQVSTQW